jgi:hypothetical protein
MDRLTLGRWKLGGTETARTLAVFGFTPFYVLFWRCPLLAGAERQSRSLSQGTARGRHGGNLAKRRQKLEPGGRIEATARL